MASSLRYDLILGLCLIIFAFHVHSAEVQLELKERIQESQLNDLIDLILVLDDSATITDEEFELMKKSSKSLIETYSRSEKLNVGIVKIAANSQILSYPTSNYASASSAIDGIQRERGISSLQNALRISEDLFARYGRDNSKRILFLITDGRSSSEATGEIAQSLKFLQNVVLFGFGVGNNINRTEMERLCSFNNYFALQSFSDLSAAVENLLLEKESNKREVILQPFLQHLPLSFKQDIPLRLRISNIGKEEIPAGSIIYFTSPTNYLVKKYSVKVIESIGPHEYITVSANLPVSGSASVKTIPEYIDIEMMDVYGKRIYSEHNRIMLSTEYMIKSFVEGQLDEVNILIFGCIGSGKTSWLNAMLTALSSQVQYKGVVGDSGGHGTEDLVKFSLYEGINGVPKIRVNFWDSWGVTPENYENQNLFPALLDGRLPEGYHMKQRSNVNQLKNLTLNPEPFDAVLLFLPWDIIQQKHLSSKMLEVFQVANKKGFSPIVIVTHIDKIEDEVVRQRTKEDIADLFKIPENRIHLVHNYVKEESKNFTIDKRNLIILDEVLRVANGKAAARKPKTNVISYISTIGAIMLGLFAFFFTIRPSKPHQPTANNNAAVQRPEEEVLPVPRVDEVDEQSNEDKEQSASGSEEELVKVTENKFQEKTYEHVGNEEAEKLEVKMAKEEGDDGDEEHKCVEIKVVSGASRQFRISKATTFESLLLQAKMAFVSADDSNGDYYLSDQKGAIFVSTDKAWGVSSTFYLNQHTTA